MGANLGQMGQNHSGNHVFCHFLQCGSLVFLEIEYNDSLQQCIKSSRAKIPSKNKICGLNFGQTEPNSGQKLVVFAIFSSLDH